MFTGNHLCASFTRQLLRGQHNLDVGGNQFKLALYNEQAALDANTLSYTPLNEIPMEGGYVAGGFDLTQLQTTFSGPAAASFQDLFVPGATFSARGGLIYNATPVGTRPAGAAVMVLDFGLLRRSGPTGFTVRFPPPTATEGLIRIL